MKISYKISLAIIITATLHIVGLAAYIFDAIPESWHQYYFYNLDRIYIIILLSCFYFISIKKEIKLALLTSLSVYSTIAFIINLKYFVTLSYHISEKIWIYAMSGSILTCLITLLYVIRRQISK